MSTQENLALVRTFFARLGRDQALPMELLDSGLIYHVGATSLDLAATLQRVKDFTAGFSGVRHAVEDLVAQGDLVAFRSRVEMTHDGTFMGVTGSGERISVVEMGFFRIAESKIAEMWGLLDNVSLLQQIGAMPSPA
jgi:predicted ester cyclase